MKDSAYRSRPGDVATSARLGASGRAGGQGKRPCALMWWEAWQEISRRVRGGVQMTMRDSSSTRIVHSCCSFAAVMCATSRCLAALAWDCRKPCVAIGFEEPQCGAWAERLQVQPCVSHFQRPMAVPASGHLVTTDGVVRVSQPSTPCFRGGQGERLVQQRKERLRRWCWKYRIVK